MTENKEIALCLGPANAYISDLEMRIDQLNEQLQSEIRISDELSKLAINERSRRVSSEKEAELSLFMMMLTMFGSVVWLVADKLF